MVEKNAASSRTLFQTSAWIIFAKERFQIPGVLIVAIAQSASAQYIVSSVFDWFAMAISVTGISALLITMRMMDELKDFDTDKVAHPDRPLPRGLISPKEVRSGLWIGVGILLLGSILIGLLWNTVAGSLLGLSVGYSLLMYREFFVPEAIGTRPFWYAITHQIILVPIYAFATATASPEATFASPVLWFAMTGLGASFALEVCRKLDPNAHPALGTYLSVVGWGGTVTAVVGSVALASYASYQIGVHMILWPIAMALLGSLALTVMRPQRFKWTAGLAALFVLAQVFAPTIIHFTGALR